MISIKTVSPLIRVLLLGLGIVSAIRCSNPANSSQGDIEITDSLIGLITEVHLLEAQLTQERSQGVKTDSLADRRFDSLFARYHTTRVGYDKKLKELTMNPELLIAAYDSVIVRLQRMEATEKK